MFDLNSDGAVDAKDHHFWVKNLKLTWYGDANLEGEFNTGDMNEVLVAGKYEQGWLDEWGSIYGERATWSEGDWNGDGVFDRSDMVTAFVDGGYEKGLRAEAVAVPEPGGGRC